MFNPFSPSRSQPNPAPAEEEVVDLSEIDLDFAVEEAFRQAAPKVVRPIVTVPAEPDDLRAMDLFRELSDAELVEFAPLCQSSRVVPGYVLFPAGRINTRVHFVVEGQLRLYRNDGGKRPCGIVDIGQSEGLSSAMSMQPTDFSLIATESSQLLVIDAPAIEKMTHRSHTFARNYAALMASYARGEHCLRIGEQQPAGLRRDGYIDPVTLLHNQRWLDSMFPRIVERSRMSGEPLSLVAFQIDRLDDVDREAGVKLSRYILEAIGQLMVEHSRPTDLHVFDQKRRLLVVLPESNLDAARLLANRLRERVKTLAVDDLPIPTVTLSIGIVMLQESESAESLLGRADTLIQKSINAGGNWLNE